MSLEKKMKHYRAAQKEVCGGSQSDCKTSCAMPKCHTSKHVLCFCILIIGAFLKGLIIGCLFCKFRNKQY